MEEGAEWAGWLWVFGQGAIMALFAVFFSAVLRLWRHLANSDCAYNPARPRAESRGSESDGRGESNGH